ncbi:MAG: hypothetical protein WBV28_11280 [Terracidiphilus sp.]
MRCSVAVLITVLALCVVAPDSLTQAQTAQDDGHTFLRDPNNTFVFLKFDHLGTGVRRTESEPSTRIWLRFVNNTNIPIQLQAYGTPQGSLRGEVGVMDNVVLDPPMLTITSDIDPPARAKRKGELESSKMPVGYLSEVSGGVTVAPGDSVLFSVPISHIGYGDSGWHMEIPFKFGVPRGHGARDPLTGGEPILTLWYSHYDLPDEAKAALEKLR